MVMREEWVPSQMNELNLKHYRRKSQVSARIASLGNEGVQAIYR